MAKKIMRVEYERPDGRLGRCYYAAMLWFERQHTHLDDTIYTLIRMHDIDNKV